MEEEPDDKLAWGVVGALFVTAIFGAMGDIPGMGVLVMMIVVCALIWVGLRVGMVLDQLEASDRMNQFEDALKRQPFRGFAYTCFGILVLGGGTAILGGVMWIGTLFR